MYFLAHLCAYSMVLRVLCPSSGVRRPSSGVRRLASSVRSITPTVLKMISPYCIQIFVMYVVCVQKNIVAPSIKLNSMLGQK